MKKKGQNKTGKLSRPLRSSRKKAYRSERRAPREGTVLDHKLSYQKKHIDKLWEQVLETDERLQDLEVQTNLITRLLTLLCLEKLNIDEETFRKLVQQVEREAIEDSQIMHLEHLFSLEHPDKESPPKKRRKPQK